jgi:sigma-E factor negative regulatory protein RseA
MSDQEQVSQLSALFDGQLPPAQAQMVLRRALKDPATRESWGRYALIGAAMRNEPFSCGKARLDVAARVRARLAAEAEHAGAQVAHARVAAAAGGRSRWLGRAAMGGAIAASVAVVSLVVMRSMTPVVPSAVPMVAQNVVPQAAGVPVEAVVVPAVRAVANRDGAPPSYTTPAAGNGAEQRLGGPLVNYVVAHSEVPVSALRFSPLSTVMNGSYDLTQGAVEMTAAEIGARR